MTIGTLDLEQSIATPQKTLWTPTPGSSTSPAGSASSIVGTAKPLTGDLMVAACGYHASINTTTGLTIGDTGSGGWTAIVTLQTNGKSVLQGWWKQATSADYNSGSGVPVTVTQTGGTGTLISALEVDCFNIGQNIATYSPHLAIQGVGQETAGSTVTTSTTTGTPQTALTDQFAWVVVFSQNTLGAFTGSNAFVSNLSGHNLTSLGAGNSNIQTEYATLIPTPGINYWTATWTNAVSAIILGTVFYWA